MPIVAPLSPGQGARDTLILEPVDLQYASNPTPADFVADQVAPEEAPIALENDLSPELIAEDDAAPDDDPDDDAEPATFDDPALEPVESSGGIPVTAPAKSPLPTFPWGSRGSEIFLDSDELEQTLIVPRREAGERFVLQFSTGESVTVFGSGLLGRNPSPQPGEYFDQLVAISDPGKSVSKTHLEFGQEAGSFWVSDRYSGNGSVVREPESGPRRLTAGKRYRIVRGTRVDIGEQFFVVS
jgi:hypothetical protein